MKKLAIMTCLAALLSSCGVGDLSLDPPSEVTSPQTVMLYQKAASGNVEALRTVEKGFTYGQHGLPRDSDRALECAKMLAERGSAEHQRKLGMAYMHGKGVMKNEAKAQTWLSSASAHGDVVATRALKALKFAQQKEQERKKARDYYKQTTMNDSMRQLTQPQVYHFD